VEREDAGVWKAASSDAGRAWSGEVFKARLPGVLFAWVLVSLGAPFWYDAIKNLLKFRSVLAQKEEKSRDERNTAGAAAAAAVPAGTVGSSVTAGARPTSPGDDERGDLQATGAAA
jgi:hypothetical protein